MTDSKPMNRDSHLPPPEVCDWLLSQDWSGVIPITVITYPEGNPDGISKSERFDHVSAGIAIGSDEIADVYMPAEALEMLRADQVARNRALNEKRRKCQADEEARKSAWRASRECELAVTPESTQPLSPAAQAVFAVPPAPATGEVGGLVAKLRRLAPQNPLGTADPTITRAADFRSLCAEVLDYSEGRGKYNFSHLKDYDRDNAAFDAWQDIKFRLKSALDEGEADPIRKAQAAVDDLRVALSRMNLEQMWLKPVPVGERPPGAGGQVMKVDQVPEPIRFYLKRQQLKDCCLWLEQQGYPDLARSMNYQAGPRLPRPAHALPIPQQEVE